MQLCDNGMGIPAEDWENIFDKFYRHKNSVGQRGMGLGLALSRAIMRKHGGDLLVLNSSEEGTCWGLRFGAL